MCSVCFIADRSARPSSEWQGDEGLAMLARLDGFLGDAPLVFAGSARRLICCSRAVREAGFAGERLIGSAPEALAVRRRAIVAMEARVRRAK